MPLIHKNNRKKFETRQDKERRDDDEHGVGHWSQRDRKRRPRVLETKRGDTFLFREE
jgi:hypothetical protein